MLLQLFLFYLQYGLILFSRDNLTASKDGIYLWASSVVPALLPFFIACELLSCTNIIDYLGNKLRKNYETTL